MFLFIEIKEEGLNFLTRKFAEEQHRKDIFF